MPLPNACTHPPPIKGPSLDKQNKQVQFLVRLIKGLAVNPMANFKLAKIKHGCGHMKTEEANLLSLFGQRKQATVKT